MDVLEAAVRVLEEQGEPLHWTVIQDIALQRGYLDPFTERDIRRRLLGALSGAARKSDGPVMKAGRGIYALRGRPQRDSGRAG
ncbi:MAG: winged helix-turn-helix domain-containing protein [Actinomycetota bacterium]